MLSHRHFARSKCNWVSDWRHSRWSPQPRLRSFRCSPAHQDRSRPAMAEGWEPGSSADLQRRMMCTSAVFSVWVCFLKNLSEAQTHWLYCEIHQLSKLVVWDAQCSQACQRKITSVSVGVTAKLMSTSWLASVLALYCFHISHKPRPTSVSRSPMLKKWPNHFQHLSDTTEKPLECFRGGSCRNVGPE